MTRPDTFLLVDDNVLLRASLAKLIALWRPNAIVAEASGTLAKENIVALGRFHRVQASLGFHEAASYIAAKAREF